MFSPVNNFASVMNFCKCMITRFSSPWQPQHLKNCRMQDCNNVWWCTVPDAPYVPPPPILIVWRRWMQRKHRLSPQFGSRKTSATCAVTLFTLLFARVLFISFEHCILCFCLHFNYNNFSHCISRVMMPSTMKLHMVT